MSAISCYGQLRRNIAVGALGVEQSEKQGEFMGRVRVTFWPVVGIVGFIVFVLCGLGLAVVAVIFVGGAPHAFPPSPGIAAILFLLALLFVALGGVLLRRSIRALSAMRQSGSQQQVRTSLYVVAGAALLVVVGAIVFPWVYKPWRPAKGSVQHADRSEEHTSELQSQSNLVCRLLLEKKKIQLLLISHSLLMHSTDKRPLHSTTIKQPTTLLSSTYYYAYSLAASFRFHSDSHYIQRQR